MQEAEKRQRAHAKQAKDDAYETKRGKELQRMEIQVRRKKKDELHALHIKELQEVARQHEKVAAEQKRVLELANARKRARKEARLRAKQEVAARNRRIQEYRAELLRKAADRDDEMAQRHKVHNLELQKHRKENIIDAWRKVEILKKSFEKRRVKNKSIGGSGEGGVSPKRPAGSSSVSRVHALASPRKVYTRPAKESADVRPETLVATLDPYRQDVAAICHVKETVMRVEPPSTLYRTFS
jgi:hypothetical protein